MEFNLFGHSSCGTILTVKVGGSKIIGLQKQAGAVPPTYNGSDAHTCFMGKKNTGRTRCRKNVK